MGYEFHGEDFAEACARERYSGVGEIILGESEEVRADYKAGVDYGRIVEPGVFLEKL